MYVYRMENKQGRGPYDSISDWMEEDHVRETGRPGPWEDELMNELRVLEKYGEVLFACPTLDAAHAWFTEQERYNLAQRGFMINRVPVKEITVDDDTYPAMVVGESECQCIFIREKGG